ncbi:MAG: pentapeptide repeat-containing protein [Rhodococcus sp.]|uniref:pentapeptide repeat-containing protein n=1 Tax=Rhodococcus TaxID=1827 RepID=UPI0016AEBA15|nr:MULTISPECIES: pentapeptide repeat-containing protein [Rhodococcus]NLV79955.1 pentapeptide repeat-containing protein [Rhodococcus sp. (in: high G+C Gram-positive bacteria)]
MADRATRAPRIDALRPVDLDDHDADELVPHSTYEQILVTDAVLGTCELAGAALTASELRGLTVDELDVADARFVDTRITRVQAPRMVAQRCSLHNVRIDASRIGAMDLFDCGLRSVVVSDSKLGLVNLRGATVRDVVFRGCILDELDVSEARFTRVAFEDCTVGELDVHRATFEHVDLRGLHIGTVRNLDGMRGATITGEQAVALTGAFAAHLGIRID